MSTSTTPRPPRPRPRARRLTAAGNVVVSVLVALGVGWLLNAPGILKTAEGMPLGLRRDVAVALSRPVAEISSFLQLDRPRQLVQHLAGRTGEDAIEVSLPSPTLPPEAETAPADPAEPVPTTTTTVPEVDPVFTSEAPLRVWVGGDSLSITPGESLIPRLDDTGAAHAVTPVDGHVATGLARPEVFNWPQHLQEVLAAHDPHALVLTIGSNDDQGLTNAPTGTVGGVGSPEWQDEYRRRVGGLMDAVATDGRFLFWVGIPVVRDTDRYARGYEHINQIVFEEAEKRPRVFYVETYTPLSDRGGYVDFRENPDGTLTQTRAGDGIHFTRAGGDVVAERIMEVLLGAVDLESPRDQPPGP